MHACWMVVCCPHAFHAGWICAPVLVASSIDRLPALRVPSSIANGSGLVSECNAYTHQDRVQCRDTATHRAAMQTAAGTHPACGTPTHLLHWQRRAYRSCKPAACNLRARKRTAASEPRYATTVLCARLQSEDGVDVEARSVSMASTDGTITRHAYDLLVGADGARSLVRQAIVKRDKSMTSQLSYVGPMRYVTAVGLDARPAWPQSRPGEMATPPLEGLFEEPAMQTAGPAPASVACMTASCIARRAALPGSQHHLQS